MQTCQSPLESPLDFLNGDISTQENHMALGTTQTWTQYTESVFIGMLDTSHKLL